MKAQLEETKDAARKEELLPDEFMAEDGLRRREDYLRLTIDTIPVLAWCTRPDGSTEFLNQRWLDYTGLAIEEARGWGWKVAIHPDDLPQLLDVWQGLLASGKPGELEARLRRADGVYRWFLFRVEPLHDAQGTIVKWYGTNTDIDDRKRAETLLAGENQILEMVATGKPLGVILDGLCRLVDKLSSEQARCGPIILNWRAHTDCERVGPHQSCLQMAVCWARSRFTGVNRAAQARIINRSSNRSHI